MHATDSAHRLRPIRTCTGKSTGPKTLSATHTHPVWDAAGQQVPLPVLGQPRQLGSLLTGHHLQINASLALHSRHSMCSMLSGEPSTLSVTRAGWPPLQVSTSTGRSASLRGAVCRALHSVKPEWGHVKCLVTAPSSETQQNLELGTGNATSPDQPRQA